MHDVGFVMIDQDLWITFRRFCEETGEEMGMYTERLINIELSRPRPAKPEEPLDSLKLVMLAGNYGELVRTFGAEHVRRCHDRYLGPEPAAVDSRTVPAHSTTGQLLRSLELILHEVRTMEDALRDAPREKVADGDRRRLRWEVGELRHRAQFLMNWLSEARLEEPKQ